MEAERTFGLFDRWLGFEGRSGLLLGRSLTGSLEAVWVLVQRGVNKQLLALAHFPIQWAASVSLFII